MGGGTGAGGGYSFDSDYGYQPVRRMGGRGVSRGGRPDWAGKGSSIRPQRGEEGPARLERATIGKASGPVQIKVENRIVLPDGTVLKLADYIGKHHAERIGQYL